MWTSSLLKQNGWNSVKPHYWTALGVIIVMSVISGIVSYAAIIPSSIVRGVSSGLLGMDNDEAELLYSLVMVVLDVVIAGFVTGVLETGKSRYFYQARANGADLGNLFWGFQSGRYMSVAKVMFWRYLQIFLWSLLFCIPGIIKVYETMLVPYLMAENPNLTKDRALEISKQTMNGEKMKCFVLQISFIGWYFLGLIACYVGLFAVIPYYEATMAEFYACMRAKMLSLCITTEEELTNNYDLHYGGGYPDNTGNYYQNQNPYQQNPYQNQNPYQQNPYQNQNSYQQSPYQNQNPYQQSPYQDQNSYQQSPYQNPDSGDSHKVNLNKDNDDHYPY